MIKKRDAQGLSINIMILAVIGLVVLVVVLFIFTKESNRTVNTLESCEGRGGTCRDAPCPTGHKKIPFIECEDGLKICCIGFTEP